MRCTSKRLYCALKEKFMTLSSYSKNAICWTQLTATTWSSLVVRSTWSDATRQLLKFLMSVSTWIATIGKSTFTKDCHISFSASTMKLSQTSRKPTSFTSTRIHILNLAACSKSSRTTRVQLKSTWRAWSSHLKIQRFWRQSAFSTSESVKTSKLFNSWVTHSRMMPRTPKQFSPQDQLSRTRVTTMLHYLSTVSLQCTTQTQANCGIILECVSLASRSMWHQ